MVNQPPGIEDPFSKIRYQLLVDPVGEFLGQGVFGVDRFVELALCGLVCGFAVDVDGGHCQPVLTNSL